MTTDRAQGAEIRLRGVEKTFGDVPVLRGVDLDVAPGIITALLGSKGAGKTTLDDPLVELLDAAKLRSSPIARRVIAALEQRGWRGWTRIERVPADRLGR